ADTPDRRELAASIEKTEIAFGDSGAEVRWMQPTPTMAEMCSALASVNACCSKFTFGVTRTSNVLFRGQRISLVFGPVGHISGSFAGHVELSLFALADTRQAEWMRRNPDVFSAAHL